MQNLQHKHQKQLTMQRRRPVWQDRKSGNAPFRPGAAAPPGFGRWAWRPGAAPPATPPGPPPSTPLPPALHQAPTQHEVARELQICGTRQPRSRKNWISMAASISRGLLDGMVGVLECTACVTAYGKQDFSPGPTLSISTASFPAHRRFVLQCASKKSSWLCTLENFLRL